VIHSMTAEGLCLCGAVRFSAGLPSLWVAHCHCTLCRRAHGAAFVTWVGIDDKKFTLEDAARSLRWYRSSPEGERAFCGTCGSPLFFRSPKWPGEIHIAVSHLCTPLDRAPQTHVHFDTHVSWFDFADSLPKQS
jgi:hypothetical protein